MRFMAVIAVTALFGAHMGCGRSGLATDVSHEGRLVAAPNAGSPVPQAGASPDRADARVPPLDRDASIVARSDAAQPPVFRDDCTDETTLFIYVVTEQKNLYRFDPVGGGFHRVGAITCGGNQTAFSMAVARDGTAFVSMTGAGDMRTASLWRVSTLDASCEAIPEYVPGQMGFTIFGMGFATERGGPEETLFIAGAGFDGGRTGLASLDTTTFEVSPIGAIEATVTGMELTGSGDGRLFAFFSRDAGGTDISPDRLGELDKQTGELLWDTPIPGVEGGNAWAVAHWGGDFYFFTTQDTDAQATQYRLEDDTSQVIASLPQESIVGAGVTTCARVR